MFQTLEKYKNITAEICEFVCLHLICCCIHDIWKPVDDDITHIEHESEVD